MAFRFVATVDGRRRRLPLTPGEQILGSHPDCSLRVAHSTVSRRHAKITVGPEEVVIEDLGSRNGIRLDGKKVETTALQPGDALWVGAVPLVLEIIPDEDLEAAVLLSSEGETTAGTVAGGDETTLSSGPAERFVGEILPELLTRVADGAGLETTAQLVGSALFELLPCSEVAVSWSAETDRGVLFYASRSATVTAGDHRETVSADGMELRVVLPNARLAGGVRPLVEAAGAILRLADDRSGGSGRQTDAEKSPRLPDPPSLASAVRAIYAEAGRVARGDVGVLILGESGTGKEVLARFIHRASKHSAGPFLGLDCAALPTDLLEAELFGIEKGVATGVDERPGKFELANDGTLFLDEIGDMALETQAKLLRILQSGECYRLGARHPRRVNVRVIAATNRDLNGMLAAGDFRTDLYHRIATWVVELPALRHRRVDIPNLAVHFLSRAAKEHGLRIKGISKAAMDALQAFPWPGNIRQLENEMARAVLFLEEGELLDTGRLAEEIRTERSSPSPGTLRAVLDRTEKLEIAAVLDECDDNVDAAAERLGISRATLYRRMKALGIGG